MKREIATLGIPFLVWILRFQLLSFPGASHNSPHAHIIVQNATSEICLFTGEEIKCIL